MSEAADRRWTALITTAITDLSDGREWIGMDELRAVLDARPTRRAAQDQHLKRLSAAGVIHLAPESNRKTITEVGHRDAIAIGGQPNHLVKLA